MAGLFERLRRSGATIVAALLIAAAVAGDVSATARFDVPANDDFADKRELEGASVSVRGDNRFATRERGELDHLSTGLSDGKRSVWYSWTAPKSGPVEIDLCKSDFDTVLTVYKGDHLNGLEQISDNDDGCTELNGRASIVSFEAESCKVYHIAVAGYSEASQGPFRLAIRSPE